MKYLLNLKIKATAAVLMLFCAANVFGQEARPKLIRGEVYLVDKSTTALPRDFKKLTPITTIFVSEINVADTSWNNGFPDLPEIFEYFAIEYRVTIRVAKESTFKFRLVSDDGSKLFINNKTVVDNDGMHQFLPAAGSVKLAKGDHSFLLQYFQGPRYQAGIQLFVKGDGSKESIFPGDAFELIAEKTAVSTDQP